jgi:CubicO group peptidase (beta-lactamase class C family)
VKLDQQQLQDRLTALADKHGVIGASVAVAVGDETAVAATGVLNLRTGQPATPDSLFQIGSITKVWTATLVMQLVDDGLLDLDVPIAGYLPEFRVADADVTSSVTARHLLTHTSGIAGDFFPDNGRGDDCLSRYVAEMSDLQASHPLGATMSYCNAGFTLLGRIIEVLRGATWDDVLRERLLVPLGLEAAGTLPEEALLWGAATGHLTMPGAEPLVAPQWGLTRSAGPAGLIHARASDLLTFARLHLSGGLAPDGTRLLSERSVAAMREPQVAVPDRWTLGGHIGLAWLLSDWGQPVFGHDGGTIGQSAFFRVVPGSPDVTVALLTNGGDVRELYQDVYDELLSEHSSAVVPPRMEPPTSPLEVDVASYVGTYARESMTYVVEARDGELLLRARPSGAVATAMGTDEMEGPLVPYAPDTFLTSLPGISGWMPAVFYSLDDGSRYLHLGGRATPLSGVAAPESPRRRTVG